MNRDDGIRDIVKDSKVTCQIIESTQSCMLSITYYSVVILFLFYFYLILILFPFLFSYFMYNYVYKHVL